MILPASKPSREANHESKIEFHSRKNQIPCALDYSSEDGEHGFGVVKAAWTADSNYFVFSLTSSGSHQPWHAPTFFYNPRSGEIHSLDSYVVAARISKGDFGLKPPNVVLTEVWRGQAVPLVFRLDALMTSKHKSQHPIMGTGGMVFQPKR